MSAPILFPDRYQGDNHGRNDWSMLAKADVCSGAILKASEGVSFQSGARWFKENWQPLREAGGDRYGGTWFRGAFHFLIFHDDPVEQANYFLKTIEDAGGFVSGDLLPIVDVERGGEKSRNHQASAARIVECTSAFTARVKDALGCGVILYGGSGLRDLGIRDRMGCDYLWYPHYRAQIDRTDDIGWSRDQVVLWQYTNGEVNSTSYPQQVPGLGPTDLSVYLGDPAEFPEKLLWSP